MSRIDDMPTEFEWKMFPGITTLGFLEKIQSLMRPTVWTWALQWQDHVQWHCMARKRKQRKMWIQFTDSCESCSQVLSGHLSFLGPRSEEECVRNLHWQTWRIMGSNCREHEVKFLRIWSSNIFVPPVPLREENYEAKKGERSLLTSMVVMKTSSCFSARWFLRICSVSTEP